MRGSANFSRLGANPRTRVQEILKDIEGIEFVQLGARDVVRHKIVQDIVEAYRVFGEQRERADG